VEFGFDLGEAARIADFWLPALRQVINERLPDSRWSPAKLLMTPDAFCLHPCLILFQHISSICGSRDLEAQVVPACNLKEGMSRPGFLVRVRRRVSSKSEGREVCRYTGDFRGSRSQECSCRGPPAVSGANLIHPNRDRGTEQARRSGRGVSKHSQRAVSLGRPEAGRYGRLVLVGTAIGPRRTLPDVFGSRICFRQGFRRLLLSRRF
jgi:hypothetical protein